MENNSTAEDKVTFYRGGQEVSLQKARDRFIIKLKLARFWRDYLIN